MVRFRLILPGLRAGATVAVMPLAVEPFAIHSSGLFHMGYEAPRIHDFPKHLPQVEAIAQSARPREKG